MRKHWQTAISGKVTTSLHAVLWVETERAPHNAGSLGLAVKAKRRRLWPLTGLDGPATLGPPLEIGGPDSLASALQSWCRPRKKVTLWIVRGWEDMVLSGFAELMERGLYKYTFATLDGARTIMGGRLGQNRLDVTSLAAWTGGEWDAWRGAVIPSLKDNTDPGEGMHTEEALAAAPEDERCAVATVGAIVFGCGALRVGNPRLSVGAQARAWWRAWGGPTMRQDGTPVKRRTARHRGADRQIVPPIANRPPAAAQAEHHCCAGLVREHYYRGHVGGRVYVVDLTSAYLLGLVACELPAIYEGDLQAPHLEHLKAAFINRAGCALVRLEGTQTPHPVRHNGRPARAIGSFWAWLTAPDLGRAFAEGRVAECHSAYLWRAIRASKTQAAGLLMVAESIRGARLNNILPLWRALYSSLVGSWAQRAWRWEDSPRDCPMGRWATWTSAGKEPGTLDRWRCIAGRVQRREYAGEAAHALPLAYATVVAAVREQVDCLRCLLPADGVLATACDSLWLNKRGFRSLMAQAGRTGPWGESWRVKERYDDAWLDGAGKAVVAREGRLYPLLPGVPSGAAMDDTGRARWEAALPWSESPDARPDKPRLRRGCSFDGARLVKAHAHQLLAVTPWVVLNRPALPEELLKPFDPLTGRENADG